MLFGHTKRGIFSLLQPSYVNISRKLTRDNRVLTDFRHLNVRIAETIWFIHYSKIHSQY